jgi:hypothetical protein
MYTSCVQGLRPSSLFNEFFTYKKKKKKREENLAFGGG